MTQLNIGFAVFLLGIVLMVIGEARLIILSARPIEVTGTMETPDRPIGIPKLNMEERGLIGKDGERLYLDEPISWVNRTYRIQEGEWELNIPTNKEIDKKANEFFNEGLRAHTMPSLSYSAFSQGAKWAIQFMKGKRDE